MWKLRQHGEGVLNELLTINMNYQQCEICLETLGHKNSLSPAWTI